MTDASSDSDESAGRVQEWEVVSLSTLSMSGSGGLCNCETCTSAMQEAGSGRSGGVEGPHANLLSNHFGSANTSPMLDQFLSESESRTGVEDRNDVPMDVDGNNISERPVEMDMEEETHQATNGKEEDETGASETNYLPEMDWIEPMPPNTDNLMHEESDIASNSSIIYDMTCEKKRTLESDYREPAGPLLGSCMSAPSAAAIVSSVAAFRAGLGEDLSSLGGEESTITANCVVEEELAGLEREILGTDSGFESFHETPVLNTKKLGLIDTHSALTDALLGEGVQDHACEAWWKRRAALWFVEARQANTLWSLALAAAVMGLVILGQRWQHERCQNNHLRLQLCSKDEKISQLIFQVARLKDALSGRRRVPVLRTSSSYNSFRDRF